MDQQEAFKVRQRRQIFREHPEIFFHDVLGVTPTDYQVEIAQSVVHNRVTTVASCNSAGKTGITGCIVPWYLLSYSESIVVTTAPKWQQVKDLLWREINTRWEKAKYPLSSNKPNVVSWDLSSNWFAVGVASKDPSKIQGYHADSGHLLVIIDEAAAVDELMFEGVWALMTAAECRLLMLGNPTSQSGFFRASHKATSTDHKIRIDMFDTPNFKSNNIRNEDDLVKAIESKRELALPYPMLASPQWGYESLRKWGSNSPMYQARCRARFPEVGENNLIPLNWIEQACSNERLEQILGLSLPYGDDKQEAENERIRQQMLQTYMTSQDTIRGVDVARFGSDTTVVQPRWGAIVGRAKAFHKMDTMQTAGYVWSTLENKPTDLTCVDVIGVGAGVVDRLRELQAEQNALGNSQFANIIAVNVAEKPMEKPEGLVQMEFANSRAELYWRLRGMFERGEIYLMPDENGNPPEELMDELSSIQYKFLGDKIYIEEKAEMKKRLQKSPDRADALMLTLKRMQANPFSTLPDVPEEDEDDEDWEPESLHGVGVVDEEGPISITTEY